MFKKIDEDAKLPTRATEFSAGVDVYSIPIVSDDKSIIGEDYVVEGYGYEVDGEYHIRKGQKIGQLLLMEHKSYLFGIE